MKMIIKKAPCLCKGEFKTIRCGECANFYGWKTSYGSSWCNYYKSYSRDAYDLACSHFVRG